MFSDGEPSEKSDLSSAIESLSLDISTLATLLDSKPREQLNKESSQELALWKESALTSLQRVKDVVAKRHPSAFPTSERAKVVFVTSVFVGEDEFIDRRCKSVAQAKDCLDMLGPLDRPIASQILVEHLKPIFQSAAHPGVRQDTGRVKQNPLDLQNMYDEQPWKTRGVGSWNILAWVLSHVEDERSYGDEYPVTKSTGITAAAYWNRPALIQGVGSARFLKAFIPQLSENLLPKEFSPTESTLALQIASAECLLALMKNTRPRIPHWRHRILDATLRCWVDIVDKPKPGNDLLRKVLAEIFAELLVSSGNLLTEELSTLKDLDAAIFSELLIVRN
ncbi:hypothetical protein FRC07_001186 [Ceratobasidium sp. 392]|nr:hypothetical protein FRC07_001186 [Ceratobasidium sp. 392]